MRHHFWNQTTQRNTQHGIMKDSCVAQLCRRARCDVIQQSSSDAGRGCRRVAHRMRAGYCVSKPVLMEHRDQALDHTRPVGFGELGWCWADMVQRALLHRGGKVDQGSHTSNCQGLCARKNQTTESIIQSQVLALKSNSKHMNVSVSVQGGLAVD